MEGYFEEIGIQASDVQAGTILGESPAMQDVLREVSCIATTDLTAIIRGESGCGKELIARLIHHCSNRAQKPFVALNCAALSETILESELFGHERGAFSGAVGVHKGRFERANGGTLFLDEIGDISPSFQLKLLRVLQEGEYERVGATQTIKTDVRIIAATNRNLEKSVEQGKFRLDLYFRLNVAAIYVPPLRQRREDIPLLIKRVLGRSVNTLRKKIVGVSDAALERLIACQWPGNVRELENCVLRAASRSRSGIVEPTDLYCTHDRCLGKLIWNQTTAPPPMTATEPLHASRRDDCSARTEIMSQENKIGKFTKDELTSALEQSGWVQTRAARLLGVTPRQFGYALRKYSDSGVREGRDNKVV